MVPQTSAKFIFYISWYLFIVVNSFSIYREILYIVVFKKQSFWSFEIICYFSPGGCCSYQVNLYVEYGQKYGLSPVEYHKKIFYFAQTGYEETSLVFLKVSFIILNLIYQSSLNVLKTSANEKIYKDLLSISIFGTYYLNHIFYVSYISYICYISLIFFVLLWALLFDWIGFNNMLFFNFYGSIVFPRKNYFQITLCRRQFITPHRYTLIEISEFQLN